MRAVQRHGDAFLQLLAREAGSPAGVVALPLLNQFTVSAMLESMFDIKPSQLGLLQLMEDISAVSAELQTRMRNPLRTLQLKLLPWSKVGAWSGFRADCRLFYVLSCR